MNFKSIFTEKVNAKLADKTLYIQRPVLNSQDIREWAMTQAFQTTLPPDDFHVTVAFSRDPVNWARVGNNELPEIIVSGGERQMHRFGDATVLTFYSGELLQRWQRVRDAGASWDHDGYRPHVTISYKMEVMPENIEPYRGDIILGPEAHSELNLNWKDEIKEVPYDRN